MGLYDRDYYRKAPPRGGFGYFVPWSITTWLIVINVAVFFTDAVMQRVHQETVRVTVDEDGFATFTPQRKPITLTNLGAFTMTQGVFGGQVWRFVTYGFLHAGFWHIAGNMIGLFFFGPILETHFGARRYITFYLLCVVAGALSFVLLDFSHMLHIFPFTQLVGASAGIFGLLVASAVIAPDVEIIYYFIPINVLMLAVAGMALAVFSVINSGAGGEAAHLGGGALGFLLIKNQHWLNFVGSGRPWAPAARRSRPRRSQLKDWSKDLDR